MSIHKATSVEKIESKSKGSIFVGFEKFVFPVLTIVMAFAILAPLLFLIYGAITTVPIGQPAGEFTLRNIRTVLSEPAYLRAFGNTIVLATGATLLAGTVGIMLAWLATRTDMPGKRTIRLGVMVPFFLSPFIGALAWSMLLQDTIGPVNQFMMALGLPQIPAYSVGTMIWVMGLYYAPYVFIFVTSALYNMDPILEESGYMSGLSQRQVMMKITVPIVAPAILSGMLLTFIACAGQFGVPALLGFPIRYFVLTTYMYQMLTGYPAQFNLAASLAMILLAVAVFGVWGQNRIMRGRSYATLSGKGFRPKLIELGKWRWGAYAFGMFFLFCSSVMPMAMIAWSSLVLYYDGTFGVAQLTLKNFYDLLTVGDMATRAIKNTLFLAVTGATIAVILAVIINWILHRSRVWYRPQVDYLVMVPVAVPHVVLAVGMLWTYIFIPLPIYGTIWILLIGYVTGFITYAVRNVGATFVQIDKSLEEAATMVGASWLRTMREVTLPLLKPGMVGAWTLLFIIFVRELSTSIFLYSPNSEVLAVLIFNRWDEGDWSSMAALSMIQVFFIGTVVFLAGYLFRVDITKSQS